MKVKNLGDNYVSNIILGQSPKSSSYNSDGIGMPFFQGKKEFGKVHPKVEQYTTEPKKIAEVGDILLSVRAPVGPTNIANIQCCIGRGLGIIRSNQDNMSTNYLLYFFKKFELEISNKGRGSTFSAITRKDLESIQIPIPPLDKQKTIAQTLDKAKELIELRKASIKKLDELSKSVFIDMFGDPVENPMGWEVLQIKEVITFLTSGSRGWAKYYSDEGEVFIRIQNVKNGSISFLKKQYINAPSTQEAIRTKVQENDLLLSITADLGRTGVVTKELANENAYISQHLALLRLKSEFSAVFLSAFIETKASQLQLEKLNQGGTKAGLNFNAINSFKLFSPPTDLQNKFAKTIQKIESQKALYEKELVKLEENFEALLAKSFG